MTIIALTGLLVVGAAAASILGRASVPSAGPAMASAVADGPISNRESKKDKLAVIIAAQASFEPPATDTIPATPLRQAFASSTPADIEMLKGTDTKAMDPVALP